MSRSNSYTLQTDSTSPQASQPLALVSARTAGTPPVRKPDTNRAHHQLTWRLVDLTFAPPRPGLQPGGRHLGGRGCGLSATLTPTFAIFAAASSYPISARAEIVAATSIAHAIQAPDNFETLFMTPSVV
jgi:hypothetical protein